GLPWEVPGGTAAGGRREPTDLPGRTRPVGRADRVRHLRRATVRQRLGGLRQAALRRAGAGAQVPRPLHPPARPHQPPPPRTPPGGPSATPAPTPSPTAASASATRTMPTPGGARR